MIRQPEFVIQAVFECAWTEAREKAGTGFSDVSLRTFRAGLRVLATHIAPYQGERGSTIALLQRFLRSQGLPEDIGNHCRYHEVYLSDPRRTVPDKLHVIPRLSVRVWRSVPSGIARSMFLSFFFR